MQPKEEDEQIAFVNWLKINKIMFFAPINENNHSFKDKKLATIIEAKSKRMGKVSGVSDIFIFLEKTLLVLELKRRPLKLKSGKNSYSNSTISREQEVFLKKINGFGYCKGIVVYGYLEAIKAVEDNM